MASTNICPLSHALANEDEPGSVIEISSDSNPESGGGGGGGGGGGQGSSRGTSSGPTMGSTSSEDEPDSPRRAAKRARVLDRLRVLPSNFLRALRQQTPPTRSLPARRSSPGGGGGGSGGGGAGDGHGGSGGGGGGGGGDGSGRGTSSEATTGRTSSDDPYSPPPNFSWALRHQTPLPNSLTARRSNPPRKCSMDTFFSSSF
nr:putative glycine-rich cell wall structural protein 1 [Lolium perenne]